MPSPSIHQVVPETRRAYRRLDAAKYLDMSVSRLDELIRSGEIAARKDGKNVKIDRAELDRYFDSLPSYEPAS